VTLKQFNLCLDIGFRNQFIFHSNLLKKLIKKAMSFKECLCDPTTRDAMARGVVQSVNVVGMDIDAYEKLAALGTSDSVVAKNYL
tara:strand:- start:81 stop:335 length:255 start_codon:yes stop_codon:yes gene_type:complete